MKLFCSIIFILASFVSLAQRPTETEYLTMMDEGANLMYEGQYTRADSTFKIVLANLNVLPANLAFYFGRNSFYLEKYKQAINWLNKYIELRGTKGQYFDEAISILEASNTKFATEKEQATAEVLAELTKDTYLECPHDKVLCPVCKGSGVLIKGGAFGNVYQTCPFDGGDGFLTCDEYNLFLRGELQPAKN